ncbi:MULTISPECIES: Gfo/Idh/MocA family protein [unclassified Streptomyces]|uniref:Gfo/Idh/MocA family protein n=1 Tax=unclassified Streptomyces TaxID=2593676 RepID=UPI00109E4D98|nr:Gfo/Idh/MocA family oxidoreductase [Streptomyces sp. A1136]THA51694.1 Gfo/Idh/MocA family oxidoreductase [Streptomyces sp. A1136]
MAIRRVTPGPGAVRYGLIGPGSHARENLLPALAELDGAVLTAVAARRPEAAAEAARRWGARLWTDDWTDLVEGDGGPAVDCLVVAGSPALHAEVLGRALAAGVSVFVEKPPAPDTATLERLVAAERAAPTGTVAFVGFNFPYGQSYRKLRDTLRPHGTLRTLDVRMVSAKPMSPVWGSATVEDSLLQGLGTHAVDLALRELGVPDRITARRADIDARRRAFRILLEYADGRLACLLVGNYSNRLEYRCELVTDEGVVGGLDHFNTLTVARPATAPGAGFLDGKETLRHDWPGRRGGYGRTGYATELESFHRSVVRGGPGDSPLSSCLDVYRVLDEVRRQTGVLA